MRYAKVVCGVFDMQKCRGVLITRPGIPAKYRAFADFADFATKKALPLALISVRQVASGIRYHFLISSGLGFD